MSNLTIGLITGAILIVGMLLAQREASRDCREFGDQDARCLQHAPWNNR